LSLLISGGKDLIQDGKAWTHERMIGCERKGRKKTRGGRGWEGGRKQREGGKRAK